VTKLTRKLTVVADENIARLNDYLADIADIRYLPGRNMSKADVADADALLVRSITPVNSALLEGSNIQFVGSCTIGTDHVDLDYLQQQAIRFANAPGCNAEAVVDYVLAAMFAAEPSLSQWQQKKALIVGCGQVGSRLFKRLSALGIACKISDPFLDCHNATDNDWLTADMISLHVPLTKVGAHPTLHLLNAEKISQLKQACLVINSCRGKVIDNEALLIALQQGKLQAALDVYEQEPTPTKALLDELLVATGHIAGYSEQGKIRGTVMVVEQLFEHFAIEKPLADLLAATKKPIDLSHIDNEAALLKALYDIQGESTDFKQRYLQSPAQGVKKNLAENFDQYRKNYQVRTEWGFYQAMLNNNRDDLLSFAKAIGLGI
jgi:erythronate-4-phosphate dehydrogenase